jgi:hypothetical protein
MSNQPEAEISLKCFILFQFRSSIDIRADPSVVRRHRVDHQRPDPRLGPEVSAVRIRHHPDPKRSVRAADHQKFRSGSRSDFRSSRNGVSDGKQIGTFRRLS